MNLLYVVERIDPSLTQAQVRAFAAADAPLPTRPLATLPDGTQIPPCLYREDAQRWTARAVELGVVAASLRIGLWTRIGEPPEAPPDAVFRG